MQRAASAKWTIVLGKSLAKVIPHNYHCPRTCSERNSADDCPAFCNAANAPGVATSLPRGNNGRRSIAYFISAPVEGFVFASSAPHRAVQKKQIPFLAVAPRLAVRAVKAAQFAFTGAKRKPLTEEAHGLGAGFCQEGKRREDREANDDGAKQQKRPRLCAGAESGLQSERSLVGLGRWLAGRSLQFLLVAIELARHRRE